MSSAPRHHRRFIAALVASLVVVGVAAGVVVAATESGATSLQLTIRDTSNVWNPVPDRVYVGLSGHPLQPVDLLHRQGALVLPFAVTSGHVLGLVVATQPRPTRNKEQRIAIYVPRRSLPSSVDGTLLISDQTVGLDVLGGKVATCRTDRFAALLHRVDNVQLSSWNLYFNAGDNAYQWNGHWRDGAMGGQWVHAARAHLYVTLEHRTLPLYAQGITILGRLAKQTTGYGDVHRLAELMLESNVAQAASYRDLAIADNPASRDVVGATRAVSKEQALSDALGDRWVALDEWLFNKTGRSSCNR